MSYSKFPGRTISLLVFPALMLNGQALISQRFPDNVVPLKNWAAAPYWQPNVAERRAVVSSNALPGNPLIFVAITPCRLVDSRGGAAGFNGVVPFTGPSIPGAGTVTYPVQSAAEASTNTTPAPCGVIPAIAQAYSLNVTVIPKGGPVIYITMWPAGSLQPVVATLGDPQGAIVANAAIVPAGTPSGGISLYNGGPAATDVVIDMNGYFAAVTDVNSNTALGTAALTSNTTGTDNTGSGDDALHSNTTGSDNTASGFQALFSNTTGSGNTASGYQALLRNVTGVGNTASGHSALANNTIGNDNTASGDSALNSNTSGGFNTATGSGVMLDNTNGNNNTASGYLALQLNTTGSNNTATGFSALSSNTSGSNNIAIGYQAGQHVAAGNNNNIHIGTQGISGDSGVIRIGDLGTHTSFVAAGVSGVTSTGGVPVLINSSGQMGTVLSSLRYKEDVQDMADSSSGLLRLRPVTFRYKKPSEDGSKPVDYGLIAEEVAEVYPDLVVKGADGQIETVQYQKLTPMLLNELQKQHEENRKLEARLAVLEAIVAGKGEPTAAPDR
jgi:hypothetical protein